MPAQDHSAHIELQGVCKDYAEHGRPHTVLDAITA